MSGKTFGKADTSIDFPAGTDMALTLDQPLRWIPLRRRQRRRKSHRRWRMLSRNCLLTRPSAPRARPKNPGIRSIWSWSEIPTRFSTPSNKQAGAKRRNWAESRRWERFAPWPAIKGMEHAPVSQLYLFGRAEDLAFEKMLNTFLKRHHLRLWRTTVSTADGREIWLGASTHDIGMDMHVGVISHAIDPNLDAGTRQGRRRFDCRWLGRRGTTGGAAPIPSPKERPRRAAPGIPTASCW